MRGTTLRSTSASPSPSRVSASGVSVTVARSASFVGPVTFDGPADFAGADAAGLLGGPQPARPRQTIAIAPMLTLRQAASPAGGAPGHVSQRRVMIDSLNGPFQKPSRVAFDFDKIAIGSAARLGSLINYF